MFPEVDMLTFRRCRKSLLEKRACRSDGTSVRFGTRVFMDVYKRRIRRRKSKVVTSPAYLSSLLEDITSSLFRVHSHTIMRQIGR